MGFNVRSFRFCGAFLALLAATATACGVAAPPAAHAQLPFNSVISFGDSLSDNGNVYAATGGTPNGVPKSSPYVDGLPTDPTKPYFGGRFTNGPVWVETLAAKIGVPLFDFAYGGSLSGNTNLNSALLPGIQTQVDGYLASLGGANANPGTLFTLFGGANDYLGGISNPNIPVDNLLGQVDQLLARQAQNILIVGLPDLGKLPATINSPMVSSGLTALTVAHNTLLLAGVQQRQAANPARRFFYLDGFALFNDLKSNSGKYGITNPSDPYVFSQGQSQGINPIVIGSGPINKYLFMDEVHPTQTGHDAIADRAFAAVGAPEPGTIALLVPGAAVLLGGVLRRRSRCPVCA